MLQVLISSNDSGRIYEVSSRIPGSNIVSLNMERNGESNGTHVYIMGTNKVRDQEGDINSNLCILINLFIYNQLIRTVAFALFREMYIKLTLQCY